MITAVREYRNYLSFIIEGHRIAEVAMQRLGRELQERGYDITDEALYDASAKVMQSKTKSTIKTIANAQTLLRKKLNSKKPYYREALEELEILPEFVFDVLYEKQLMEAVEPHNKTPEPEEVK